MLGGAGTVDTRRRLLQLDSLRQRSTAIDHQPLIMNHRFGQQRLMWEMLNCTTSTKCTPAPLLHCSTAPLLYCTTTPLHCTRFSECFSPPRPTVPLSRHSYFPPSRHSDSKRKQLQKRQQQRQQKRQQQRQQFGSFGGIAPTTNSAVSEQ